MLSVCGMDERPPVLRWGRPDSWFLHLGALSPRVDYLSVCTSVLICEAGITVVTALLRREVEKGHDELVK